MSQCKGVCINFDRCKNISENNHDYCEECCNYDEPHGYCKLHGQGTKYYEEFMIRWYQVQMHQGKNKPYWED